MTKEERELTITYLKDMQEEYIEGEGYERHPLPEWYALYKAIEVLEQTHWIPVSERLPEEPGTYMTTIDYGKYGLAVGQRYYYGSLGWNDDCVIAWMPLPQPYKAERRTDE